MDNITFVEGLTKETIETKLQEAGIKYRINTNKKDPFFKSHSIDIPSVWHPETMTRTKTTSSQLISLLGFPNYFRNNSYHYYARYKLGPEFDSSILNGKITFDRGLLIESTQITYPTPP